MEQGQFNAAVIEARAALQTDPDNEAAIVVLSRVYDQLGMPNEALDTLQRIKGTSFDWYQAVARSYLNRGKYASALQLVRQHPDVFKAHPVEAGLLQAEARMNLRDFDAAQSDYQQLLSADPGNIRVRLGLATLEAAKGHFDEAEAAVAKILADHPNDVDALSLQGGLYIRAGKLAAAEGVLTRAISALPTTDRFTSRRVSLIQTMIELLARSGRTGEALTYQEMLAKAFPNSGEVKTKMAGVASALERGDFKSALGQLDEIDKLAPGNDATAKLRGVIAYLQGKDDAASRVFEQTVDPEVAGPRVLQLFAETQFKLNRPGRVVEMLRKRAQTTRNPDVLALYGVAAVSADMPAQGESALRKAIAMAPEKVRLSVLLAQYLDRRGDHAGALDLLEKAHVTKPGDANVRMSLMLEYFKAGQPEAAGSYVRQLQASDPDSASTNLVAGRYFSNLHKLDDAQAAFRKAISIAPDALSGYYGLAAVQTQAKDYEAAEKTYREIIGKASDDVTGYRGLLQTYVDRGQTARGVTELSDMAQDSASKAALIAISQYYTSVNKDDDAAVYLKQANVARRSDAWRSTNAQLYSIQAQRAFMQGNYEQARTALFSALSSYPENNQLLSLLAQTEIAAGSYSEARKVIDQMAQADPGARVVNVRRGDLASAQGNLAEAVKHYEAAWQQGISDLLALDLYSTYKNMGQADKAAKFLQEWMDKVPGSVVARINLADSYTAKGETQKAIDVYTTLLKHNPGSQAALNNLAWVYLQANRIQEAVEASEKAYKRMPGNGDIADTYGWALFKANRPKEAKTILEHAVSLSSNPEIRSHLDAVEKSLAGTL